MLLLHVSLCTFLQDRSYWNCASFFLLAIPHPLYPSSLRSVSYSLSLSLPELTTQEVTTDSINSSYINPAIIAPHVCLSAPSSLFTPSFPLTHIFLLSSYRLGYLCRLDELQLIKVPVHLFIAAFLQLLDCYL